MSRVSPKLSTEPSNGASSYALLFALAMSPPSPQPRMDGDGDGDGDGAGDEPEKELCAISRGVEIAMWLGDNPNHACYKLCDAISQQGCGEMITAYHVLCTAICNHNSWISVRVWEAIQLDKKQRSEWAPACIGVLEEHFAHFLVFAMLNMRRPALALLMVDTVKRHRAQRNELVWKAGDGDQRVVAALLSVMEHVFTSWRGVDTLPLTRLEAHKEAYEYWLDKVRQNEQACYCKGRDSTFRVSSWKLLIETLLPLLCQGGVIGACDKVYYNSDNDCKRRMPILGMPILGFVVERSQMCTAAFDCLVNPSLASLKQPMELDAELVHCASRIAERVPGPNGRYMRIQMHAYACNRMYTDRADESGTWPWTHLVQCLWRDAATGDDVSVLIDYAETRTDDGHGDDSNRDFDVLRTSMGATEAFKRWCDYAIAHHGPSLKHIRDLLINTPSRKELEDAIKRMESRRVRGCERHLLFHWTRIPLLYDAYHWTHIPSIYDWFVRWSTSDCAMLQDALSRDNRDAGCPVVNSVWHAALECAFESRKMREVKVLTNALGTHLTTGRFANASWAASSDDVWHCSVLERWMDEFGSVEANRFQEITTRVRDVQRIVEEDVRKTFAHLLSVREWPQQVLESALNHASEKKLTVCAQTILEKCNYLPYDPDDAWLSLMAHEVFCPDGIGAKHAASRFNGAL